MYLLDCDLRGPIADYSMHARRASDDQGAPCETLESGETCLPQISEHTDQDDSTLVVLIRIAKRMSGLFSVLKTSGTPPGVRQ